MNVSDSGSLGEVITSPANPTIKIARSLQRRRVRQRERAILVEGVRAIETALDLGTPIRVLFIDASRRDQIDFALLDRLYASAGRVMLVSSSLFPQLTDTEHPQPLVAICDLVDPSLPVDCTFVVALDGVRDPGNLGTLVRSCAAAGADGIALLRGNVDPFNPKAIRASVGSVFALPIQPFASIADIAANCYTTAPLVVLADSEGDQAYDDIDWSTPCLLIIGGEAEGAGPEARTYADVVASIPMSPGVESLNAAVAGSILVFEIARQRRLIG